MGFLKRLLGRQETPAAERLQAPDPACPHVALVPRWGRVEDIGKPDRVTQFTCESCGAAFPREEGERLRDQGAERVRLAETERPPAEQRP